MAGPGWLGLWLPALAGLTGCGWPGLAVPLVLGWPGPLRLVMTRVAGNGWRGMGWPTLALANLCWFLAWVAGGGGATNTQNGIGKH